MCRSAIGSRFACGRVLLVPALAALLLPSLARGEPYWIAYEGDDLPENQGWTRYWGNHDGEYQGPGATRTIENGIITYDSLYDPWVHDTNIMSRPDALDPAIGETFVMEWRLKVEQVDGYADPGVGLFSNDAWAIDFAFRYDRIISIGEDLAEIPIQPGAFHAYRFISADMRHYELYVDNEIARTGLFDHQFTTATIGWGDAWRPAGSVHLWDYFRFGVTPEPSACVALITVAGCVGRQRARTS